MTYIPSVEYAVCTDAGRRFMSSLESIGYLSHLDECLSDSEWSYYYFTLNGDVSFDYEVVFGPGSEAFIRVSR